MVSIRVDNFNDDVWDYVVLYSRRRGVSRGEALQIIVTEHAEMLQKLHSEGIKPNPQDEWLDKLIKYGIVGLASYFLGIWTGRITES